jgi:hypothetical protein
MAGDHAGAIIALADETAPAAAAWEMFPIGEVRLEPFQPTLHMSIRAIRNPSLEPALPAMTAAEDHQGP